MSFTLLTLPNVVLRTSTVAEVGSLAVECLSDSHWQPAQDAAAGSSAESDITLAFLLNAHTILLERGSIVSLVIAPSGQRTYSFHPLADGEKVSSAVYLVIPPPKSAGPFVAQDVASFDSLLSQYAQLAWSYGDPELPSVPTPPLPPRSRPSSPPEVHANIKSNVEDAKQVDDPSLRGRLVLMDDSNGEVVGELPQSLNITEDPALAGKSNAPVVLELHPDMYDACTGVRPLGAEGDDLLEVREVFARVIPPEEQDWVMKGATLIR
ncbi:hypothetical protein NM688_g3996 [Phlebia brevispora]|uniref:Uncharacterized protein n=1 Tax=Phlebia brevispora TaxID=194682 RepID=A0ACC1T441_9APHY|nr:hypothetical protein NM688_g3996 [Phlebia brevispora]